MIYIAVAIFGLIFGSFLNVCIYRIPRGKSIVTPRSHCPKCGHKLAWHENIPVVSFVLLGGKCARCKKKISGVYPVVEILTALLAVTLYGFFGFSLKAFILFALFSALIVSAFVDFERQEIPDVISLPGIAIGLLISFVYPELLSGTRPEAFLNSFLGVLAGGGSLYLIGFFGRIAFKKDAMGGGDIKLLAMIGAFLGWKIALLTFFIAPFFGLPAGIVAKVKNTKKGVIPYGPYLSLGAFVALLWGEDILGILFRM